MLQGLISDNALESLILTENMQQDIADAVKDFFLLKINVFCFI